MEMVVGPVLKRAGGYAFDAWTPREGMKRGFAYRRLDDAIYAQKATIKAAARGVSVPLVCQTLEEFSRRSLDSALLDAA